MLTIGNFAKISHVPIRTLRFYDRIGLLKPSYVDPFTSYRYYSYDQFPRLNRILALKDLGLSLDQIMLVLEKELSADEIHGMLRLKQAELEAEAQAVENRLQRVMVRLKLIKMEGKMPKFEVVLKQTEAIKVASRRIPVPYNEAVPQLLSCAYREVAEYISEQGGKVAGPSLTIWYSPPDAFRDEDVEAALPIDRHFAGSERVKVRELPVEQVASVTHSGNFSDFGQGHTALAEWIKANGYRVSGPYREVYLKHNHENLADSATEIQIPVEKR